jgi:hypothetical protein
MKKAKQAETRSEDMDPLGWVLEPDRWGAKGVPTDRLAAACRKTERSSGAIEVLAASPDFSSRGNWDR